MRRPLAVVLITLQAAACLAACQPSVPTGTTGKPAPRATRAPAPVPTGDTLFPPIAGQAGNVVSNNGGGLGRVNGAPPAGGDTPASPMPLASLVPGLPGAGIVANNGAALTGKVKAPAGLISDRGGGLIGNNGGGLIGNHSAGIVANNGAGYRLQGLPAQDPVADIPVGLVDATGALVKDAAGVPMVTRTAADGSYAFPDAPTDRSLFVLVDLPAGHGQLAGFAAANAAVAEAAAGRPAPRTVDLDLVSTLTTGYIYNQYVAWQPDPQATIAKLPADVEAQTRAKAEAAFAASGAAVPDRLGPGEVQATVARLRVVDDAFDGQMETVRKLLVVAGQADLGNGRKATEVQLTPILALGFGPDGRLYMNALVEQRVWRLTPEGILENAAGATKLDRASLTGVAGPEAGLAQMFAFGFDAFGRLLLPESGNLQRLSRLEPDGRLTELLRPTTTLQAVWPGAGGEVLALLGSGELVAIAGPGQAPKVLHTFSAAERAKLAIPSAFSRAADGKLLIRASGEGDPRVYRFDPTTKVLDTAKAALGLAREPMLDANGRLFDHDPATRALALVGADGALQPLGTLPRDLYQQAITLGPDGAVYLAAAYQVYKLQGGQLTVVAGIPDGGQGGGDAGDLALAAPSGILPEADGSVLVADKGAHRIWRVKADRTVVPFAGTGAFGQAGDGGPAAAAQLASPQDLARDAAGNLFVITPGAVNGNAIRKIAPDGTITTVMAAPIDQSFAELEVAPDGTIFTVLGQNVLEVPAGTTQATIIHTEPTVPNGNPILYSLKLGAGGALHWAVTGSLQTWTEAGGVKLVKQDRERILGVMYGGLAFDAKGRWYLASFALHTIERFDSATSTFTTIAGPGAPLLAGSSPADSLKNPTSLAFDANGDLLVADEGHKQVKRLAAGDLPP